MTRPVAIQRRRPDLRVVAAEAARQWVDWTDPAARHERRKERAGRWMAIWLVLAVLCAVGVAAANWVFLTGMVVFMALGARSGVKLRRLHRMAPPPARRVLPSRTSVTREPMRRLGRAESALHGLLAQLSSKQGGISVGEESVAQARATAADAARSLHGLADRIAAVELARDAAPASERAELTAAVRVLRGQLDDGIESYGGLVAAAGKAVAARDSGLSGQQAALTDATDRLAGMASALRELN
ncbi:MAG: phage shock envelope stress response protein PspM [Thermocrispum sp.]